jgi:hypothetical protein
MVILGARWLAQMRGQSGRHTSASVPSSSELERAWRPGLPAIVNPGAGSPRSMGPAMHGLAWVARWAAAAAPPPAAV